MHRAIAGILRWRCVGYPSYIQRKKSLGVVVNQRAMNGRYHQPSNRPVHSGPVDPRRVVSLHFQWAFVGQEAGS